MKVKHFEISIYLTPITFILYYCVLIVSRALATHALSYIHSFILRLSTMSMLLIAAF